MDPLRLITAEDGFFTRPMAKNAGYDDRDITRLVRAGHWTRFRRGAYAFTDEWKALDEVGRHRVRCRAVMRSLGGDVALSHGSGVVAHDIDVWDLPLDKVHVTRLDGASGRIERDVVHHEGRAVDDDVVVRHGMKVLRAERCVLEAGSRTTNEVALCLFDSGLRAEAYDEQQLLECHKLLEFWPFMRHLHIPVRMADARSGSVGESRGRWAFRQMGIPCPDLQHEVHDGHGHLLGTTDWWWEQFGLLGEFDGRVKYGRLLKPGQEPGDVVFQEKRREDLLRETTGCRMIRFVWSDYGSYRSMFHRFNAIIGRGRAG